MEQENTALKARVGRHRASKGFQRYVFSYQTEGRGTRQVSDVAYPWGYLTPIQPSALASFGPNPGWAGLRGLGRQDPSAMRCTWLRVWLGIWEPGQQRNSQGAPRSGVGDSVTFSPLSLMTQNSECWQKTQRGHRQGRPGHLPPSACSGAQHQTDLMQPPPQPLI